MINEHDDLRRLAGLYGVQTSYTDSTGRHVEAEAEPLLGVLRALGAPVESGQDVAEALRARGDELARRVLEPVVAAWDGQARDLEVRLPVGHGALACHLDLENGERRGWVLDIESLPLTGEGTRRLTLPESLPMGYHRLRVETGGQLMESLVISAPTHSYTDRRPLWGVFLPLYALRTARSWGAGDFSDLETLAEWTASLGGGVVATLPLLATFLDEPFEPSPYAPASRLFWNELYLDPRRLPEFDDHPAARRLLESPDFQNEIAALQREPQVDYARCAALKRRVLEEMSHRFFARPGDRYDELDAFAHRKPDLEMYAAFRAVADRRGEPWQLWPERLRDGSLAPADFDEEDYRYHLWCQWACDRQIGGLARQARRRGPGLYLDLPLGVHGSSFDVWRERDLFVQKVAAGAPPDSFFTQGQNWGFPPLQPERLRERGYDYLIDSVRHHLEHAGLLRIDHVMQLHRLFWIPEGMEATHGVYVDYPAEELYALLCLESHRHQAMIVGENLGTVPPAVYESMERHDVMGMFVAQYEIQPDQGMREPPVSTAASLNTHDMPTFSGFLEAKDVDDLETLGFFDADQARAEREKRERLHRQVEGWLPPETRAGLGGDQARIDRAVLRLFLDHLATSPARMVLVNLEDLWGETAPQNVPGTHLERPNWRRKARYSFEEFSELPEVVDALRRVDELREGTLMASPITEQDVYLFNEGTHFRLWEKLGAHAGVDAAGRSGVWFSVWAPNAERVAVIGDWNAWDLRVHPLAARSGSGLWEGFVPGVEKGARYKFHVASRFGGYRADKADPYALYAEVAPGQASVLWDLEYAWGDAEWMAARGAAQSLNAPMSIYEVHLGSWRRVPEEGNRSLTYREIAPLLAEHMKTAGFTHVELLPVMEHPFFGSWGYQSTGFFAPTSRHGTPQDFMYLIDHLHQNGIGVILDWVPSHFPTDEFALGYFDGTHLYEHADPRQGFHPDWGSYIFNYGRNEVRAFLISSALFWLEKYHADGLRVDAVASMLYLDYSRKEGEWIPNRHGGRENLEAIAFLRTLNEEVYESFPDIQTIAEESTAWPMVSRPTYVGGLGFGLKWDMGWMHDTLKYMAREPVYRKYHHNEMTFRGMYAFSENFVLPLSHDEVVHGKGSLAGKMPGDAWRRLATLRLLYGYMWAQPGKKLLFMGGELAQYREWNHDASLDWHLLDDEAHAGILRWLGDLNRLYREDPAFWERDVEPEGFEWIDANDTENSVFSFLRNPKEGDPVIAVFNCTPHPHDGYRIGVPATGHWREILNSDSEGYGGTNKGNPEGVDAEAVPLHGRTHSVTLTLPPLGVVFLKQSAGSDPHSQDKGQHET